MRMGRDAFSFHLFPSVGYRIVDPRLVGTDEFGLSQITIIQSKAVPGFILAVASFHSFAVQGLCRYQHRITRGQRGLVR